MHLNIKILIHSTPSYACAISDGLKVVLTGGFGNRNEVSVYSLSGFEGNLPDLNIGRQYHACASYKDGEKNVGIKYHINKNISINQEAEYEKKKIV